MRKALDICAGAGGLSLGLQRAGFDVLGVESCRDAVATHRRHVGPCLWTDARFFLPPPVVLVAGGVPCTPFSPAGNRLGVNDPRYLVPVLLRIAAMAHARAVMIENSSGMVTNRKGEDFRLVLEEFERREWIVTWRVLDAANYGVPQHRRRVFVVGFRTLVERDAFRWPVPSHGPPGSLFDAPFVTVREALGLGTAAFRSGLKEGAKPQSPQGMRLLNVDSPAPTVGGTQPMRLRRRASERLSDALSALDVPAPTVRPNAAHEGTDPMRASRRPMGQMQQALSEAGLLDLPSVCITAGGTEGGGGPEPIANRRTREQLHVELAEAGLLDRPSTVVAAESRIAGAGHHGNAPGDRQMTRAVRLTPDQCAALQGFPPGWTWEGTKTSQYRQIGNAVPPALAHVVGAAILDVLEAS